MVESHKKISDFSINESQNEIAPIISQNGGNFILNR